MTLKHFHGSCHCKRVTFEADIDLSKGTGKCNCTSCWKKRWWAVRVDPTHFRSLSGAEAMSGYKSGQATGHTGFCKHCGVIPYSWVPASEWNPTEYVSVNVAALDDLDPADLIAAPVKFADGRHDNWWNPPAETRHL